MALGEQTRIPAHVATTLSVWTVCAMLACAGDETPPSSPESLPSLPIEAIEGEQPSAEDYERLGAVRLALWGHPEVDRRAIAIDVHRGTVTLTGTVDSPSAKLQALRAAAAVDGVRAVIDRLRVRAGPFATEALDPHPSAAGRTARPTDPTGER